jgi:hypothetical protein
MKYLNIKTLLKRNPAGFFLLLIFLLITGCKTQQQTPSVQTPEKKSELTAAEKDRLLQSEYRPERSVKINKGQIDSLANEKAGLVCKKKGYETMISKGEQVEQASINSINEMLTKLEAFISGKSSNPEWLKYFNEKFEEYMKNCDN